LKSIEKELDSLIETNQNMMKFEQEELQKELDKLKINNE
tara:strand:- start:869 stop:985 length:117 start_codon:yes stop_codon:yes gene_type:complete